MLETHGGGRKAKSFEWEFQDDYVRIKNKNERREDYPLTEILDVLNWLTEIFRSGWFPLANNVAKLGKGTEIDGLGVAILLQRPKNISHAQGASYLGVILEHAEILEWNNKQKGIQWRIIRPDLSLDEARRLIKIKTA